MMGWLYTGLIHHHYLIQATRPITGHNPTEKIPSMHPMGCEALDQLALKCLFTPSFFGDDFDP